jgi:plastocyanin
MHKIRRFFRPWGIAAAGVLVLAPADLAGQRTGTTVTGRVSLLDKNGRAATDVDQAVIWLAGGNAPAVPPDTVEMATENKQFVPRLVLLPVGSTVGFPNHDPFNHNVFSLSPEAPFDLGLYGRGGVKRVTFGKPGIIRVFCNVHAQMRALIVVRETGLVTQPGADGSFKLEQVPPGDYVLHAWHERAPEVTQSLRVGAAASEPLSLTLDARGYRFVQHKDKNGRSYGDRSRRY